MVQPSEKGNELNKSLVLCPGLGRVTSHRKVD